MDKNLTLLSEALHGELDFLKERIKKVELLISKIVEEAAKESVENEFAEKENLGVRTQDYLEHNERK
tara:strand:- start:225 stop:425 length:201 start_codon:yes stop_codon:yes gene_type:complete